jgi:type II secretory pathway pseudopilin PulG
MNRSAFSVIEMIVTMTIIGLSFAVLPQIMEISSKSVESTKQSEGFYHGVAKAKIILAKAWDENVVNDFETKGFYGVLSTDETSLACPRDGHYSGDGRRKCSNNSASAIGQDNGNLNDFNDADDFNGDQDNNIEFYSIASSVEYVKYEGDNPNYTRGGNYPPSGKTSNIKRIIIDVKKDTKDLSSYIYYAANIGMQKPFVKSQ